MLAGNAVATAAASTVTIVVDDDAVSIVHTPPPLVNRTYFVYCFRFVLDTSNVLKGILNVDIHLTPQPVNAGDAAHVTTPPELVLGVSDLVCKLSGSGQ